MYSHILWVTFNEITTKAQAARGNRCFMCYRTNARYTSHSNGYIRRTTINSKGKRINYQLNRKDTSGRRIMINDEYDRLVAIQRYVDMFRSPIK